MRKLLVVFAFIAAFAGCDKLIEPEPPARIIEFVSQSGEAEGILAPVEVVVRVLNEDSIPVVGEPVVWTVDEPGAGLGLTRVGSAWVSAGHAADTILTDSAGQARQSRWVLGPRTGEQRLRIDMDRAEALEVSVVAEPGIVLVGFWEGVDEETRTELPSDTFRVHATRKIWVDHALENARNGEPWYIIGSVNRGPGIDSGWLFHLIPMWARVNKNLGGIPECMRVILSEEDLEQVDQPWNNLCSGLLRLVRIEEVPQEYLDRLVEEAEG